MVEASSAGRRAQIKEELMTMTDQLWANFETYDTVLEDASKNYIAKQTIGEGGNIVNLIKYRADGLTEEQWSQWTASPTIVAAALNPKLTRIELPDDEGHKVVLLKMKMPMVISNRSIVTTFYEHTKEDGTKLIFHSSRGNEEIAAANADKIGKDVVGNNVITHMSFKPYEGGIELQQCVQMDPAGSIPSFIKNKMAKRMANGL